MNLFTIATLLLVAGQACAQDTVTCQFKYLPNHTYSTSYHSEMEIDMQVVASPGELSKLKMQTGLENPIVIKTQIVNTAVLTTGMPNKAGEIPFTVTYPNAFSVTVTPMRQEKEKSLLTNKTLYARILANGHVKLDSVAGSKPDERVQKLVDEKLKAIQGDLQFTPKELKIGGSFTKKGSIALPIEGAGSLPTQMISVYTLTEVKDGQAYFDVHQTIRLNYYTKPINATISGDGDGKAIYDIKNNFMSNVTGSMSCNFTLQSDNRTAKGLVRVNETQAVAID